jgi:hypothetical protein
MAEPYEAIEGREGGATKLVFIVELASGETMHFEYRDVHFKRVKADRTQILVYCYSFNLLLTGARCDLIAAALDGHYAGKLRVHSSERYGPRPSDPDKPVIDTVEVYLKAEEGSPDPTKDLPTKH